MITRIQVMNYKSLRRLDIPMSRFHVLVGPNASGKSAFLDVLSFLHDFISKDLDYAVEKRTDNFFDLVWGRGNQGNSFEITIELDIPSRFVNEQDIKGIARYELSVHFNDEKNEYEIAEERCFHKKSMPFELYNEIISPSFITSEDQINKPRLIKINRKYHENKLINEYELEQGLETGCFIFSGKWKTSGLTIPPDEQYEPSFHWIKRILLHDINVYNFNSLKFKEACKLGTGIFLESEGSNLPWVVKEFKKKNPDYFNNWLTHIQTSLPDLTDIRAFVRPEDRHCYLMLKYKNGVELPSWAVSDGTLRLLALTLPAYLPDNQGVYMFEEPENGIHPQAIETVIDSLKSFYNGQVLITTHSPLILSLVKPEDILCFWSDSEKGTQITTGDKHPVLQEWKKNKDASLGVLFASGILDGEWGDDERSSSAGL